MAEKDDQKNSPGSPLPPGISERKPPSRALLLGLLLVILGAAAYFYAMEMMAPEPVPVPAAVTKQLITPPPPADSPPTAPSPAAADGAKAQTAPSAETGAADKPTQQAAPAAEPAAVPQPSAPPQEAPKLAEKGVLTEVPAASAPSATAAVAADKEPAAGAAAVTPAPAVATASPAPEKPAAVPTVAKQGRGAYTLLAGAYISPAMLKAATAKVRALGYQPRTFKDAKLVEMTRVRLGAFAPLEAQAKLAEIKTLAPDAFTLPEGDQVAVYAASHFNAAAHQAFAAQLRQAGVVFEEEKAMRKLPMTELSFGDFPDQAAAEKAAAKARKAGLEIVVLKRP